MFDALPPSVTTLEMATCLTAEDWEQMPATLQLTRLFNQGELLPEAFEHLHRVVRIECDILCSAVMRHLARLVPTLQILHVGRISLGLEYFAALPNLKDLRVKEGSEADIDLRVFPSLVHFEYEGECEEYYAPAGTSTTVFMGDKCRIVWSKA